MIGFCLLVSEGTARSKCQRRIFRFKDGEIMKIIQHPSTLLLIALFFCFGCSSAEQKKAAYLEKGDKFYSEKQYKEAIIEYRNVLQIDANNVDVRRKLALSYYSVEDFGNALHYLLEVRDEHPDDLDIRLKVARCYFHFGKLEEGRKELNIILEKEPQ